VANTHVAERRVRVATGCSLAAGTLEVRGSFFTIFDGKLLLLAKDGSFYNADDGMDGLEPVRANLLSHPLK